MTIMGCRYEQFNYDVFGLIYLKLCISNQFHCLNKFYMLDEFKYAHLLYRCNDNCDALKKKK